MSEVGPSTEALALAVSRPRRARPQVQSSQIDYALHTLGWAAFQDLCTSIFEVVFDRPVTLYAKVRDGGQDGSFRGSILEPATSNDLRQSTLQTKHISRNGGSLKLSNLAGEREKVRRLVQERRAHDYVLMTNAIVTAHEAKLIEDALKADGVVSPTVLGRDWITKKIHENAKIRATVPRLYGLGDLSWIIDERAVAQALEVLSSLGNDMRCYVRTKAHLKAVDALLKYGFVLLIGEPAAGKSTIAANLALTAIDIDGCDVIRVTGPQDVVAHWNPREKNRFFWIDDAFGTTQYRPDSAEAWNKVLPTMSAALRCGNRFVLTSRDYIWRQAKGQIKTQTFTPLLEGRVVIYAEDLTLAERERILYNHIKLGDQPIGMRRWMKPHLPAIAANRNFKPEIARRLGNALFTRDLEHTSEGLMQFVDAPRRFLADVLGQLEPAAQAAVAVTFLNGGRISSPITEDDTVRTIEATLGITCPAIKGAMEVLNGTLLMHIVEGGQTYWTYKHPTIADAYAELIAKRPELIEIYLRGAKLSSILHEVVCGSRRVAGAVVRVPRKLFGLLSERLREASPREARIFLSTRTDVEFRAVHIRHDRRVLSGNLTFSNPLLKDPDAQFFLMLFRDGLMTDSVRSMFAKRLEEEIVHYADVTFLLDKEFISFLGPELRAELLHAARTRLLPNLGNIMSDRATDCDADDPEAYFEMEFESLEALQSLFSGDKMVKSEVEVASGVIEEAIEEARAKAKEPSENDRDLFDEEAYAGSRHESYSPTGTTSRPVFLNPISVFDDIDL
jgi:hypothetical protein